MSAAVLTGRETQGPTRPSWWRMIGAVLGGTIAAFVVSLLWMIPLTVLHVLPDTADAPGHGWPWRIDGFWTLAADLGPLLLFGATTALIVEAYTTGWTGVCPRRLPLVLVIAAVGWVPAGTSHSGVFEFGGLLGFIAVVWVARTYSVKERSPWRWTRASALLTVAAVLALMAATVSYGALHPLTAASDSSGQPDQTNVSLLNDGPLDARVLGVDPPDSSWSTRLLSTSLPRGERLRVFLKHRASGCSSYSIHSLSVRMRIAGREVRQNVLLDVPLRCSG